MSESTIDHLPIDRPLYQPTSFFFGFSVADAYVTGHVTAVASVPPADGGAPYVQSRRLHLQESTN